MEAVSAAIFTHSPGSVVYTVIVGFMLLPLVWLRSLKRLAFTALLADVAILFGLLTVYSYDVAHLADQRSVHVRGCCHAPRHPIASPPHVARRNATSRAGTTRRNAAAVLWSCGVHL